MGSDLITWPNSGEKKKEQKQLCVQEYLLKRRRDVHWHGCLQNFNFDMYEAG